MFEIGPPNQTIEVCSGAMSNGSLVHGRPTIEAGYDLVQEMAVTPDTMQHTKSRDVHAYRAQMNILLASLGAHSTGQYGHFMRFLPLLCCSRLSCAMT